MTILEILGLALGIVATIVELWLVISSYRATRAELRRVEEIEERRQSAPRELRKPLPADGANGCFGSNWTVK